MRYLALVLIFVLSACASPAENMSARDISQLTDKQLCDLSNGYLWETKTEVEIGRRGLNCDAAHVYCMEQGIAQSAPAMSLCVRQYEENEALKLRIEEQKRELERERAKREAEIKVVH